MIDTEDQYVSPTQAAKLVGMSLSFFLRLVKRREGPASVTVAGHRVYRRDVVLAWDRDRSATIRVGRKRKGQAA